MYFKNDKLNADQASRAKNWNGRQKNVKDYSKTNCRTNNIIGFGSFYVHVAEHDWLLIHHSLLFFFITSLSKEIAHGDRGLERPKDQALESQFGLRRRRELLSQVRIFCNSRVFLSCTLYTTPFFTLNHGLHEF